MPMLRTLHCSGKRMSGRPGAQPRRRAAAVEDHDEQDVRPYSSGSSHAMSRPVDFAESWNRSLKATKLAQTARTSGEAVFDDAADNGNTATKKGLTTENRKSFLNTGVRRLSQKYASGDMLMTGVRL